MPVWLLLELELRFNKNLKPIFSKNYRPDLQAEGSELYYGMHFVSGPATVNPEDQIIIEVVLRAFPKNSCTIFKAAKKFL